MQPRAWEEGQARGLDDGIALWIDVLGFLQRTLDPGWAQVLQVQIEVLAGE